MKRNVWLILLVTSMTVFMAAGCGSKKEEPVQTEVVEEATVETEEVSTKASKTAAAPKEVEIDGVKYLEVDFDEDDTTVSYSFEGYGVTVVSDSEEVGTNLIVDAAGVNASFDVTVAKDHKIEGQTVEFDITKLKDSLLTDTDTGAVIAGASGLSRLEERGALLFEKAYYDYNNTLYVNVLLVSGVSDYRCGTVAIALSKQEAEATSSKETPEPTLVMLDSKAYLEIWPTEDEAFLGYSLADFGGVILYSKANEVDDVLTVADDGKTVSFEISLSHDSVISTHQVSFDYTDIGGQLGDTEIEEFSDLGKKSEKLSVYFGKAYYDLDSAVYVDVFVTGTGENDGHFMKTGTVKCSLDME